MYFLEAILLFKWAEKDYDSPCCHVSAFAENYGHARG